MELGLNTCSAPFRCLILFSLSLLLYSEICTPALYSSYDHELMDLKHEVQYLAHAGTMFMTLVLLFSTCIYGTKALFQLRDESHVVHAL